MTTLVFGASGATGKLLVEQLLIARQQVTVVVRPSSNIPNKWKNDDRITIIRSEISLMNVDVMAELLSECHSIACCLGHSISLKGVFGKPRKLVTDAVRLLCDAVSKNHPELPIKLILMDSAGIRNKDLKEPISFQQRFILGILRLFMPPQADNEKAANYLRTKIGQVHPSVEWVVIRPDSLIDENIVSRYDVYPSPIRSAIFDPGKTSRINVGHFMANLITDPKLWEKWKGQMPVIYNEENNFEQHG